MIFLPIFQIGVIFCTLGAFLKLYSTFFATDSYTRGRADAFGTIKTSQGPTMSCKVCMENEYEF